MNARSCTITLSLPSWFPFAGTIAFLRVRHVPVFFAAPPRTVVRAL